MFRLVLALRFLIALGLIGGVLFGCAGRLDLPFFWAYLATFSGFAVTAVLTIPRDVLEERLKPAERGRDNLALLRLGAFAVFASQWVLAGLDVGRFRWSETMPLAVQVVGLGAWAAVLATWYWAMRSNPFFSTAVRVQRERGHRVISSGPYACVRHPGYAAFILFGAGGPLALGSWWAALPHLAIVVAFVRRAALEDRMLHEELPGYAEYATRVRYRLVPGIW